MKLSLSFMFAALVYAFLAFTGRLKLPEMTGWNAAASPISLNAYKRLHDGISYAEARQIIGRDGEEQSRSAIPDFDGAGQKLVTVAYQWQNRDGSNIVAIFQNGRLMSKAQAGLH